jgi:hypothetical protein
MTYIVFGEMTLRTVPPLSPQQEAYKARAKQNNKLIKAIETCVDLTTPAGLKLLEQLADINNLPALADRIGWIRRNFEDTLIDDSDLFSM